MVWLLPIGFKPPDPPSNFLLLCSLHLNGSSVSLPHSLSLWSWTLKSVLLSLLGTMESKRPHNRDRPWLMNRLKSAGQRSFMIPYHTFSLQTLSYSLHLRCILWSLVSMVFDESNAYSNFAPSAYLREITQVRGHSSGSTSKPTCVVRSRKTDCSFLAKTKWVE